METLNDTLKFFITVISILNPVGAIPIFFGLTRYYSQEDINKISTNCAIAVFITLLISCLIGDKILAFFGIHIASFRVGGGVLISMMAVSMLKAEKSEVKISKDELERQAQVREIGIVPLAIPMLAGPGSISNSIIQAQKFVSVGHWVGCVVALLISALFIKVALNFSRSIREKLGQITINVTTRVAGLILMALAVEHITIGLKEIFNLS